MLHFTHVIVTLGSRPSGTNWAGQIRHRPRTGTEWKERLALVGTLAAGIAHEIRRRRPQRRAESP
jgi:hypothetical protein